MVSATVALVVVAAVLAAFALVGGWYSRGRVESIEDFIAARGSAGTGTLTATLVASSMGAWILFSPAEAGAAFGGITAVVGYALGSAVAMAAYAVVGPRIRAAVPEGHSLTEYAYVRYGPVFYAYVLVVSVAYMFVFLAAEFTGIASAVSTLAGVPGWQTATLVGVTVLAYTAYGGLRASMVTDVVQTALLLPLLLVVFVATVVAVGGPGEAVRSVNATAPALLSPTHLPGIEFGVYVVVAVVGAEMLNQSWWQRVYAARDERTLARGFGAAALVVFPIVVAVGLFGPIAVGMGLVDGNASVSFFLVVQEALPDVLVLGVVVLAVLLVASSADTLFNAIASVVTADLPRLVDADDARLTLAARGFTAVVALAATVVGAQGYSVLTLFLVADLLAAATFLPLYHGLFSARAWTGGALAASVAGLAVGAAFFPPARGVLPLAGLPAASFLRSFVLAAAVSGLGTLFAARLADRRYDLDRLHRDIRTLDADERRAD
ncbi:MAG: sodium:proline symporter [Haloferacaceae archaeon]